MARSLGRVLGHAHNGSPGISRTRAHGHRCSPVAFGPAELRGGFHGGGRHVHAPVAAPGHGPHRCVGYLTHGLGLHGQWRGPVLFHSSELRGRLGSHRGHVHVPIAARGYGLITWYTQHFNRINRIRAIITTIVVCRIIPGSANIM